MSHSNQHTELPRSGGILLHPTSLPGAYGIGTFGREAYDFVDQLVLSRQRIWQMCPLGPTGYGDSPYQCFSALAGNPLLIDVEKLVQLGLLSERDLLSLTGFPTEYVDYGPVIEAKMPILRTAAEHFFAQLGKPSTDVTAARFRRFCNDNAFWLDDYTVFMVLKAKYDNAAWSEWPDDELRLHHPEAVAAARETYADEIRLHQFLQYMFFEQWLDLRAYANRCGIEIVGDMPIFVAYDSAEAWAKPELFLFDEDHKPTRVAGVPPDYFSATGQLWGNPLYDWDYHDRTNYAWWVEIIRYKLAMFDYVRIDHFRGFSAYWAVPFGDATAQRGEWRPAKGRELFRRIREVLGTPPILAEDLGFITDDVRELKREFGFPGMKILQFGFDSGQDMVNEFLPHNYESNCIAYTGTHDNDTLVGWLESAKPEDKELAYEYLNSDRKEPHWDFIRGIYASPAAFAITPLQDVIGLGKEARMNTPGTLGGNWNWRFTQDMLKPRLLQQLARLSELYGRV
ncbi:MAG: 4-alpha-glucanotransferase [Spirochaeta sp.]